MTLPLPPVVEETVASERLLEVPVGEALCVLDAQVEWCLADNSPGRRAPWRALLRSTVVVR